MALDTKKVLSKAKVLQNSVRTVKSDMNSLREAHALKMAELEASMNHTSQRILAAVSSFSRNSGMQGRAGKVSKVEKFRRERMDLYGLEDGYHRCCQSTFKDLQ